MKRLEIIVNGKAYPCQPTMGAMLRFYEETGREITDINPSSLRDLCVYLWCCTVSASAREGKEFGLSLMEFADNISPEDMTAWSEAVSSVEEVGKDGKAEKKRHRQSTSS